MNNTKISLINLIESRLSMQSTQRALIENFGIKRPTLDYLLSPSFRNKELNGFTTFQKRSLFNLLAGPFSWRAAAQLIDKEQSTIET